MIVFEIMATGTVASSRPGGVFQHGAPRCYLFYGMRGAESKPEAVFRGNATVMNSFTILNGYLERYTRGSCQDVSVENSSDWPRGL